MLVKVPTRCCAAADRPRSSSSWPGCSATSTPWSRKTAARAARRHASPSAASRRPRTGRRTRGGARPLARRAEGAAQTAVWRRSAARIAPGLSTHTKRPAPSTTSNQGDDGQAPASTPGYPPHRVRRRGHRRRRLGPFVRPTPRSRRRRNPATTLGVTLGCTSRIRSRRLHRSCGGTPRGPSTRPGNTPTRRRRAAS